MAIGAAEVNNPICSGMSLHGRCNGDIEPPVAVEVGLDDGNSTLPVLGNEVVEVCG
jgi:hypothetical protein